jgi:hypothetical protein
MAAPCLTDDIEAISRVGTEETGQFLIDKFSMPQGLLCRSRI